MVGAFFPSLSQLGALAAVLVAALALSGLGAVAGGAARPRSADLVVGWGVAATVLTLAGLALPGSLAVAGWGCLAAGVGGAAFMAARRRLMPPALPWALVLAAPMVLMVAAMQPSQWDEFSQWLYSALYLVEHGAFPARGGTAFAGSFASYPFANAFPAYLAALVAGGFLENGGALVNALVCVGFALLLAELMAEAMGRPEAARSPVVAAVALLAATLANPTFVPKVVFTAYADAPTALALALLGVLGWRMLGEDDAPRARRLAVQAGLAGATLLSLKQANLVLFVLALAGMALVALRDPALRRPRSALLLAVAAAVALVPYAAWRWHVTRHFPGAEFVVRPMGEWALDILPDIVARMGSVAADKGGHFGVVAVVALLALKGLWRMGSGFDRLAVVAGTVAVGYNAFLLFAYVTAFDRVEAAAAASYWRYNTHVGPLAWATLVFGLAGLWRPGWSAPKAARWLLPVLVMAAPPATAKHFRFDRHPPKLYVRAVAGQMAPLLPQGARLLVVDPADSGFTYLLMKYLQHGKAAVSWLPPGEAVGAHAGQATHAWVHVADEAVRRAFAAELPAGASHLLGRDGAGWKVLGSWPYPGYADPHSLRD